MGSGRRVGRIFANIYKRVIHIYGHTELLLFLSRKLTQRKLSREDLGWDNQYLEGTLGNDSLANVQAQTNKNIIKAIHIWDTSNNTHVSLCFSVFFVKTYNISYSKSYIKICILKGGV